MPTGTCGRARRPHRLDPTPVRRSGRPAGRAPAVRDPNGGTTEAAHGGGRSERPAAAPAGDGLPARDAPPAARYRRPPPAARVRGPAARSGDPQCAVNRFGAAVGLPPEGSFWSGQPDSTFFIAAFSAPVTHRPYFFFTATWPATYSQR